MPQLKSKCQKLKKNLEICIIKRVNAKDCDYYKKILNMCLKRPKNTFMSGP